MSLTPMANRQSQSHFKPPSTASPEFDAAILSFLENNPNPTDEDAEVLASQLGLTLSELDDTLTALLAQDTDTDQDLDLDLDDELSDLEPDSEDNNDSDLDLDDLEDDS